MDLVNLTITNLANELATTQARLAEALAKVEILASQVEMLQAPREEDGDVDQPEDPVQS